MEEVRLHGADGAAENPRDLVSYTLERADSAAAVRFFVGPKELNVLTVINRDYASAINFGRFAVIVVPLAIAIIAFAVANRQPVTVSFVPLSSANPAYAGTVPLFVLIFVLVTLFLPTGIVGLSRRIAARIQEKKA